MTRFVLQGTAMLATRDAIVERLVQKYDPERIILFGSRRSWREAGDRREPLTGVYRARYPTEEGLLPHGKPILEDARRAVDAARKLLEWVREAVSP